MANLILNGSTSGSVTLSSPAVSGTTTLTLPATSGTVVVTSGAQTIEFADGSASTPSITNSGDTNTGIFFADADTIAASTGGSERMRIDSVGRPLINTTSALNAGYMSMLFDGQTYNGFTLKTSYATTGSVYLYFINSAGNVAGFVSQNGTTTVSYTTSSDYRLKENIVPMTGALDKVLQLKPVTYTWKQDGLNGQGFIAHELQAVVPDAVVGEKDAVDAEGNPKYQGVDTSFLVATLTAAIQEQQAIIETLKSDISELKAKVNV